MSEQNETEQVKKVQISDVAQPEGATGTELDQSQLDKVSGGGYYGVDYSGT